MCLQTLLCNEDLFQMDSGTKMAFSDFGDHVPNNNILACIRARLSEKASHPASTRYV